MPRGPDRSSPVPLYHQIVENVRYRIATGRLRPGDPLPPLRDAAKQWSVNLHTVRRAYGELERAGLIVIRRPQGASVASTVRASRLSISGLADFLADTVQTARRRFGVDARGLVNLLSQDGAVGSGAAGSNAAFVECSMMQAEDYARQIENSWDVAVSALCLDRNDEPPPGPILSTYFHFNDVRRRWPRRIADVHFVAVTLDPALPQTLLARAGRLRPAPVTLVETDDDRARDALADLMTILPKDKFSISAKVTKRPAQLLEANRSRGSVLFAPRIWSRLNDAARSHPAAVQLRYVVEPPALAALGEALAWSRRQKPRQRIV